MITEEFSGDSVWRDPISDLGLSVNDRIRFTDFGDKKADWNDVQGNVVKVTDKTYSVDTLSRGLRRFYRGKRTVYRKCDQ